MENQGALQMGANKVSSAPPVSVRSRGGDMEISAEERQRILRKLYKAVDAMRTIDHTLPMQTFAALLAVAMEEGQSIVAIGQKTGLAQSSASRNISVLTDWDYRKRVGLKLVEYRLDPYNLTTKNIYLTKSGRQLVEHLTFILGGGEAAS